MVRCLQINVEVQGVAQYLALQTAYEHRANIAIISEQDHDPEGSNDWFADYLAAKGNIRMDAVSRKEDGFKWIQMQNLKIYSCYWSRKTLFASYVDFLLQTGA